MLHDLQYLIEKDLKYFQNRQKEGDPVRIIYLDPEVLDKISFADIDRMEKEAREKNGRGPTEEELEQWLKERGAVTDPKKIKAKEEGKKTENPDEAKAEEATVSEKMNREKVSDNKPVGSTADMSKRILNIIKEGRLSAGEVTVIVQAIQNGFTAEELEYLYSLSADSEKMTQEYERIKKEKTDGEG